MNTGQPGGTITPYRLPDLPITPLIAAMLIAHANQSINEYTSKFAVIYKLIKFNPWPKKVLREAARHFWICVLGKESFGYSLNTLTFRLMWGQPLIVLRFSLFDSCSMRCQQLFLGRSERQALDTVRTSSTNRIMLTLNDFTHFAQGKA